MGVDIEQTAGSTCLPIEVHIDELEMKIASHNVQSLKNTKGTDQKTALTKTLLQQYAKKKFIMVGQQEARIPKGKKKIDGWLQISTGPDKSYNYGNVLWVNLEQPYAVVDGKKLYFTPKNFSLAHAHCRVLVVDVSAPGLRMRCIVAHLPTAKASETEYQAIIDKVQQGARSNWHPARDLCQASSLRTTTTG